jgi:hypothetical protein
MPLSAEQRKHLQENWQNIQMRANDAAAENQNELLFRARAKNNAAAIPLAYSEAAVYRLETTVRNQLDWTVNELDAMGVLVDDEAEKFVVQHFNLMTSMSMPIHFPPGVTATMMDVSAHQGAHARARMRLNNQLQREVASAIRSFKLRARPTTPVPAVVINNQFHNSPGARSYYQSTDNSVNHPRLPADAAALIANLSAGHPELEALSQRIHEAPDKKSMAEQIVRWVTAVSSIETLAEKLRTVLPTIEGWIRHLSA